MSLDFDPLSYEFDSKCASIPRGPPDSIETARASHVLDEAHQSIFQRAVQNVLSTDITEVTFTQIIEGLPLRSTALGAGDAIEFHKYIINHETPDPDAVGKAKDFRRVFDPLSLEIQVDVLGRYQDLPAGSKASRMHLVELVAVAIHRIAVMLYKRGNSLGDKGLQGDRLCWNCVDEALFYSTPFVLLEYADPAQYPEGVAELPGYWAEDQIFGGVVLFERGESGTEVGIFYFSYPTKLPLS